MLVLRCINSQIPLVDMDATRLQAQVDLSDTAFLSSTRVRFATAAEAVQCNIVVITTGAKQREGESRRNLIDRNHSITASVVRDTSPIRNDAVFLLVSNPVDPLTYFAQRLSGLPKGTGLWEETFLDSVRLRSA
jgi:L-lactate dehydrogenase